MDRDEVYWMARELLDEHGLDHWDVVIDRAVKRFGSCNYRERVISVSGPLAAINDEDDTRDTILHEIAHALAGHKAGHGPEWRAVCRQIGARPERTTDAQVPQAPWMRVCPGCNRGRPIHRRSKKTYACGKCCKKHNGGEFSERFQLVYVRTEEYLSEKVAA